MSWKKPHWVVTYSPEYGWGILCSAIGKGQGHLKFYHIDSAKECSNKNGRPYSWVNEFRPFDFNDKKLTQYWNKKRQLC